MIRSLKPPRVTSIANLYSCRIIILLLFLAMPVANEASTGKQPNQNNWFISGHTGIAIRSHEVSGNYNFIADGFRHHPGFAFDLSFGKAIGNRWEPAIRWGAYTLFGQSDLPHYSSVGYYAAYPRLLKQEPLEYVTQNNAVSLISRFHFTGRGQNGHLSGIIRPFMEAGLGINNFSTEVRYSKIPVAESSSLILRERNGGQINGAAQVVTGVGLKIGTPGEWNAVLLMNAEWVNFSSLNPVHHLTSPNESGHKAIVSRITAGLNIPIKRTVKKHDYLPFRW